MIHFGIIIFILAAYWFPRIGPLICVEKDSRVLRNLISSEPQKQKNCFLLQSGLVFKEQKLYLNKTVQGKIYGKMKQDLFGIVSYGLEHR